MANVDSQSQIQDGPSHPSPFTEDRVALEQEATQMIRGARRKFWKSLFRKKSKKVPKSSETQENVVGSSTSGSGDTHDQARPSPSWTNWAKNQSCHPAEIIKPTTLQDLVNIVKRAKTEKRKIRCAGSGHTWSSSSVVDGGFLLDMTLMTKIFNPVQQTKEDGGGWSVEVETGVLVKLLDGALKSHNPPLSLPSNVVLDSVRYGGILSLGCHGAATHTRTLPDLVTEVKIVDSEGNLNTFSRKKDVAEFKAACINLGLFGVIYSYTMHVEPLFKLKMTDTYPLLNEFFSNPKDGGKNLREMVLKNDQTEIFYWPFNTSGQDAANDHLWIKQWERTNQPVTETPEEDNFQKVIQSLQTKFGNTLYEFMAANPTCTPFMDCLIFSALKRDSERVLWAPEAIHYQAGIDNIPCLDIEMAFKCDDNFENVVKAWMFVIDLMYQYAKKDQYPFNLTLEMRFVKSSDITMSNAYDKDPEAIYCMMEILSVVNTKGFEEFTSKVALYWMENFQARPHWAKMWEFIPGIVPYLQKQTGSQLTEFEAIRKKYDPEGMFMNKTFAPLLGY
ncbi:hypothetical protein BGW38_005844 [Lunasporangiospora selenospora]|uniref:D-arabinono-1,4-lactone oxidase n=1 Tax=Lunasporangiospora selenospora TaxID=979761 RepID=A0A9P6G033_9FUNG|nr:hypothetical protein BGW38_005844 [Lunasporangiospora selenospora]